MTHQNTQSSYQLYTSKHLNILKELAIPTISILCVSRNQDMTLSETQPKVEGVPKKLEDDVLLQPCATQKKSKKQRKCDRVSRRPSPICYANNLQGEISQGVYLQTDEENESAVEYSEVEDSSVDGYELDDFYYSNWKKGCRFCRSVAKTTKPKIKPHKKVKVASKNKSAKTTSNNLSNYSAQKENIQARLDKLKIRRFGYEMYYKRCEPIKTPSNSKIRPRKSCDRRAPKNEVDHPNALKYELKRDGAAKGNSQMNSVADLQHRDITPEDYELLLMLDDSIVPKTVSTNFLDTLKVVVVKEANLLGDLCAICMEVYQECEKAKKLPCSHFFHANCIDNWLSNASPNCPLDGVPVQI